MSKQEPQQTSGELNITEYLPLVLELSDTQLEERIASDRDRILRAIFAQMPEYFDPGVADGMDAVVEWRILGRPEGGYDTFQMIIRERQCRVAEGIDTEPHVTISIGPVPFVRVVTGQQNPIRLFTFGRLSVQGNLVLAARVSRLFQIPSVASA